MIAANRHLVRLRVPTRSTTGAVQTLVACSASVAVQWHSPAAVSCLIAGGRLRWAFALGRVSEVRLFRQDTKVEVLARAPIFEGLSQKELTQIARLTDDLEVSAGTVLCEQGKAGSEFFVIMDGEVEVTRSGRRLESGGGGDFFGEIALIAHIPRTATVTAKTPVRFFVLTARAFWQMLDDYPAIERKVLRALATRLVAISADPSLA